MRGLDELKEAFLELYPAEDDVRGQRSAIAKWQCEHCGEKFYKLEFHHIVEKKNRRKFFERVFTTRMLCHDCHSVGRKYETISKYRKEVEAILLKDFNTKDVLTITGHTGLTQ